MMLAFMLARKKKDSSYWLAQESLIDIDSIKFDIDTDEVEIKSAGGRVITLYCNYDTYKKLYEAIIMAKCHGRELMDLTSISPYNKVIMVAHDGKPNNNGEKQGIKDLAEWYLTQREKQYVIGGGCQEKNDSLKAQTMFAMQTGREFGAN